MNVKLTLLSSCIALCVTQDAYAYRKFCYVTHQYPRDTVQEQDIFRTVMHQVVPFGPEQADYTFTESNGIVRCYVKVKSKDLKKVYAYLNGHSENTKVSDAMIFDELSAKKDKNRSIGLILDDFKKTDPDITIGDVKDRLNTLCN